MTALVFASEWAAVVSVVEGVGGIAVLAGILRLIECHQTGCHRLGRFRYGHLRLCHVHHPHVSSDGRIDVRPPVAPPGSVEDEFIPH